MDRGFFFLGIFSEVNPKILFDFFFFFGGGQRDFLRKIFAVDEHEKQNSRKIAE